MMELMTPQMKRLIMPKITAQALIRRQIEVMMTTYSTTLNLMLATYIESLKASALMEKDDRSLWFAYPPRKNAVKMR